MIRRHPWPIALIAVAAAGAIVLAGGCQDDAVTEDQPVAPPTLGGGADATVAGDVTIGFLVKQPEEPWFQNEWKFARECAEDNGFELIEIGATDGEKVLNAIDNLAAKGAQGFVICTPDVRLGPAIVSAAERNGMKVYTVDDQFVGSDGEFMDVPYMGISAHEIGRMVGETLWEEMQRRGWGLEGTAACAVTFKELDTARERTDGAREALLEAGFPADRVYEMPEKTTDIPGSMDAGNTLLTQHPEVERWLVYSMNDEGVLGAVRALEGAGFDAETVIAVGIGGTTALEDFKKPEPTGLFATCLISPRRHGYESTEYLYKWISEGTAPPDDIRTAGIIITRDNWEETMREQGLIE